MYWFVSDSKELLDLLLQNFGPIDIESEEGTPLQCAASGGKFDALKFLIEKGAEVGIWSY